MNAPVGLVTIHHEGAGTPTNSPRGAAGGYTYWIGTTKWFRLRDPWSSYATLNYNHVSLDVCWSGDRMVNPVTDADLRLLVSAIHDARTLGWVVDRPQVRDHHDSPGSNTVCSGDLSRARWLEIVIACTLSAPAPVPKERTMPTIVPNGHGGYWIVHADGAVFALGGAVYHGGANTPGIAPDTIVDAAASPSGNGYWLLSNRGNVYAYGDATYHGGAPV